MKQNIIAAIPAAILMLALIAVPVIACPPQCGPGEVWGIIIPAHLGPCHPCHGFECFSYPCGWFKHRDMIPAEYGCIAVSCPAIPCSPDQVCVDNICQYCPDGQHVNLNGVCEFNPPRGHTGSCSNPYFLQIPVDMGGALKQNPPGETLRGAGNCDISINARTCLHTTGDGVTACLPVCLRVLYGTTTGEGSETYSGGMIGNALPYILARNPQRAMRIIACKRPGDKTGSFTDVTLSVNGLAAIQRGSTDECIDFTVRIP